MTSTPEKSMPPLVPRPGNRGALYRGGVPGNRGGGRPPRKKPEAEALVETIDRVIEELRTVRLRLRQLARAERTAR